MSNQRSDVLAMKEALAPFADLVPSAFDHSYPDDAEIILSYNGSPHAFLKNIDFRRAKAAFAAIDKLSPEVKAADTFQSRVQPWMMACFGPEISADRIERNHRFLEEALELVQSTGCTQSEAHQLVDYVYGRPVGETHQEIGGVMVTLAALCLALGDDMHKAGETELARIWTMVEKIRAKQAAKPKHSPLPEVKAEGGLT